MPSSSTGPDARTPTGRLRRRWGAFVDGLSEFYHAPYRQTFARAKRDEDDHFMLVVLADALGVPDPAAYHSLELLPAVYPEFHAWHRRLGLDRSPLEHVGCC